MTQQTSSVIGHVLHQLQELMSSPETRQYVLDEYKKRPDLPQSGEGMGKAFGKFFADFVIARAEEARAKVCEETAERYEAL